MGLTFEVEESVVHDVIEDGEKFPATVKGIKLKEKPYKDDDGNAVKKVEWKFVIADAEGIQDGREIWGETGTKFTDHPDCKIKNWCEAATGELVAVGERIDTDDSLDRDVVIVVGLREYPDKDNPEKIKQHNFVRDVQPTRANMERMKAQLAEADNTF